MKAYGKLILVLLILLTVSGIAGAGTGKNLDIFNWKKAYFFNFYGICPLPTGQVWAVGSKGMICAFDTTSGQWVIQDSGFSRNLYDVAFVDQNTGWVAGQNGVILYSGNSGNTWTRQESGTSEHLFGTSFVDAKNGWAVGAYGTILHTEDGGVKWEKQGDQIDRIYNDVFFVDAKNGWVVGEFGVILHSRDGGQTWEEQVNPLGERTLFSVYFTDPLNGHASGMDGVLLETRDGGSSWTVIDSKTTENLFSVTAKGDGLWAVGLKGTFANQVGGVWQDATERIPTRAWLKQCAFTDSKNGWIVGSVGTVLRTVDGGATWAPAFMAVPR